MWYLLYILRKLSGFRHTFTYSRNLPRWHTLPTFSHALSHTQPLCSTLTHCHSLHTHLTSQVSTMASVCVKAVNVHRDIGWRGQDLHSEAQWDIHSCHNGDFLSLPRRCERPAYVRHSAAGEAKVEVGAQELECLLVTISEGSPHKKKMKKRFCSAYSTFPRVNSNSETTV